MKRSLKPSVFVMPAYLLIVVAMTYPLVLHMGTHIPGAASAHDSLFHVWFCHWFGTALGQLHNPYHAYSVLFPVGSVDFLVKNGVCLNVAFTAPLQPLFGLVPAINLVAIGLLIFNAYAMYRLVFYVTDHRLAAFLSGVMLTALPYMHFLLRALNMGQMSVGWALFYLLFLLRTLNEPGYRNSLAASLFLFVGTLSCLGYAVIYLLVTVVLALYVLASRRRWPDRCTLQRLVVFGVVSLALMGPLLLIFVSTGPAAAVPETMVDFSLLQIPDSLRALTRAERIIVTNPVQWGGPSSQVQIVVVILALAGLLLDRRRAAPWFLLAVFFFLLALGPYHVSPGPEQELTRLPAILYYQLGSVFSRFRFPFRFMIVVWLSVLVLAGLGARQLLLRWGKSPPRRAALVVVMIALLFVETGVRHLGAFPARIGELPRVPRIYAEILEREEAGAILSVPMMLEKPTKEEERTYPVPRWRAHEMHYQIIHGKRIVSGMETTLNPSPIYWDFIDNNTLIQNVLNWQRAPETPPLPIAERDLRAMAALGFGHVVLSRNFLRFGTARTIDGYLEQIFGTPVEYKDDPVSIFDITGRGTARGDAGPEDWIYLRSPQSPQPSYSLEHDIRERRWDRVLTAAEALLRVDPGDEAAACEVSFARKELQLSQPDATAADCHALTEEYLAAGKPRRAIPCLEVLKADDAKTHLLLGIAYQGMGWPSLALDEYRMAQSLDPEMDIDLDAVRVPSSLYPAPTGPRAAPW